jgi:hypothetical protein
MTLVIARSEFERCPLEGLYLGQRARQVDTVVRALHPELVILRDDQVIWQTPSSRGRTSHGSQADQLLACHGGKQSH